MYNTPIPSPMLFCLLHIPLTSSLTAHTNTHYPSYLLLVNITILKHMLIFFNNLDHENGGNKYL
jgi:hypothetical protein